jgi:altronate dehydratase small subunit
MMKKAVQIDEKDNVATVTIQAAQGEELEVLNPDGAVILETRTNEAIPFGHKIAIEDLDAGVNVVKYGEIIGVASQSIPSGRWVHTHNVKSARLDTSGQ